MKFVCIGQPFRNFVSMIFFFCSKASNSNVKDLTWPKVKLGRNFILQMWLHLGFLFLCASTVMVYADHAVVEGASCGNVSIQLRDRADPEGGGGLGFGQPWKSTNTNT